ncbi:ATP-dependent DNA helicase [Trichonephila clavipes]|nr:ATP-dependent DNA helicase [Trichonephila clavipes]
MKCFMYSIKWQKRGLPHVHLLLWLMETLRPNQIDEIISSEIPNLETDRKLYDTVTKNMIHGPCGALNPSSPCMKEGKCTKKYPRGLLKDTKTNDKGYPLYRRRAPDDFRKEVVRLWYPTPQRRGELSTYLIKELSYNIALLDTQVSETGPCLLPEQKDIYNKILQRVELAKIRKDRDVALAVASSGIAAKLLSSGRTAHSVFKLPLNLASEETSTCNISKNSTRGALLQQCKLIVWDKCTMSHKRALEVLDRCLQDIQNNPKLMGGVVVLLAGDFRQTLPVIEKGTAADKINACLKASYLWTKVEKLYLTTNMRAQLFSDVESGAYAQKLLEIGEGHLGTDQEGMVLFTHQFCHVVESEDELIDPVFPNMQQHIFDEKWLCERTILAPKNETAAKINKKLLDEIASETSVYNSIDTVMSSDDTTSYPVEFLNSLDLSGVPSHKLELKVGVPVLLMRNLDSPRLCNGTRLRITELGRHIVKATILAGEAKGYNVLIPRIPIIPNNLPFNFKRL